MSVRSTVLVTGASGFVGTHVLRELVAQGYAVRALVRRRGSLRVQDAAITEVEGSILAPAALQAAMTDVQAVIHLVGIIAEHKPEITFQRVHAEGTKNVVDAARAAGVRRFVHMSALGTRPDAPADYHRTKWAAEEYVRQSGLVWTIFRPSLIHGPDGEFTHMLRGWSLGKQAPFLFMPFFGDGFLGQHNVHRLTPVYVEDVARAFVLSLANPRAENQIYELGGPRSYTWQEMLHAASQIFRGRPKAAIGIPVWKAKLLLSLRLPLPFNRDQVLMSQEDNAADLTKLRHDFPELQLRGFEEMLGDYCVSMEKSLGPSKAR